MTTGAAARSVMWMRGWACLAVGLALAGCGTAVAQQPAIGPPAGAPSCAGLSRAQQLARARLVFDGVMLPGVTVRTGVLASPARVRVERYLKGHGPAIVMVSTAVTLGSGATGVAEDGIAPRAGERWRIYTTSRRQPFGTSICAGSRRLPAVSLTRGGRAALALRLWRAFPVHAKPRPIVPLGEGIVLAPTSGFPTADAKLAFLERRFALRAPLPVWLVTFGSVRVVSASVAYERLRADGVDEHDRVPPLVVTVVRPANATFATDRGRRQLPAWQFSFQGVAEPASVLALAPPSVFVPPPLHRFAPAGPGSSIEDSATTAPPGTAIKISFPGAPPGTGPCTADYAVSAVSDPRAVVFTIDTKATPVPAGQACPALAVMRTVVLHLARALGARVLVSSADGGPIPVTVSAR